MTSQARTQSSHDDLRILEVDLRADTRWKSFVAAHPKASIYHHPSWLQALEKEYSQKCLCLACESTHGELRGVLPLFYTQGLPFNIAGQATRRRLCSLPRTPAAGPLSLDRRATAALLRAAVERVRQEPGVQLQIKSQLAGLEGLAEGLVCTPWRFTYVLDLTDDPEELSFVHPRNKSRIKWAVNKAVKLGVQVRAAEAEDDLRAWYRLYLETMSRNAIPPRSYRFFAALWELLQPRGLMRLLLAERREAGTSKLLAGSIFFRSGQTVFYAFNGAQREELWHRPNDIIQWQAIHEACRSGFRWYDLGEVPGSCQQLGDFKRKWGAEPRPLYRYYYPKPPKLEANTSVAERYGLRLACAAWRRLPLQVTAWLGKRLYGYL